MEKSVNQPQKKVREDVPLLRVVKACGQFYRHVGNFIGMWAILLKYVVIFRAGPERAIQPSIGCCEIRRE